jgi:chitodextrinase
MHACGGSDKDRSDSSSTRDIDPPSAPTDLTAQAASSSSIDLNWKEAKDNVGVVAYRVYRSDAASFVASVTSTTYADTGLAADTEYNYTVRAVDAAGNESSASNTAMTRTLSALPVEDAAQSAGAIRNVDSNIRKFGLAQNPILLAHLSLRVKAGANHACELLARVEVAVAHSLRFSS